MWRAQVADPPIKEAADHFCISINQLLLCGYPESRRMHPNWACLPESVRVCEHVYTSNFVKYLSCGKEAWATPMCGWLWGPAGIDAAPFWPIGVQIKFLAYLIRDRAVLPMNDAWPSKHVFCHCHLQAGAWRRARQREGAYAQASHLEDQVSIRGTGQDHMNEHWPKKEEQEARGNSGCVWCKNAAGGKLGLVWGRNRLLCAKTTLLARARVRRRLIPINWTRPVFWSLFITLGI